MSIVATALGKRVRTTFAGRELTPCLWLCLVGRSTRLRKTTTLELARRLFRTALPNSQVIQLPSSCSFEGLIDAMASTVPQAQQIGVNRVATGWWVVNEFGAMLGNLKKKYNESMMETLTDIFDVPLSVTRVTRSTGEITLPEPCVNILTATTVDWLTRLLDESDVASGFLPRWCFIPATHKSREIAFPGERLSFPESILEALRRIGSLEGLIGLCPQALDHYVNWSREFESRKRPVAGTVGQEAFIGRLLPVVLKLSVGSAVGAGRAEVALADLEAAIVFAEWSDGVVQRLLDEELAFTRTEKKRNKVVQVLRTHGTHIQRSELMRASKLSMREFDTVLDTLIATGVVCETAGANRSRVYRLRKNDS